MKEENVSIHKIRITHHDTRVDILPLIIINFPKHTQRVELTQHMMPIQYVFIHLSSHERHQMPNLL